MFYHPTYSKYYQSVSIVKYTKNNNNNFSYPEISFHCPSSAKMYEKTGLKYFEITLLVLYLQHQKTLQVVLSLSHRRFMVLKWRISMCNVQLPHKNLVVNELKATQQRDIQSAKKPSAQMSAKRNP